MDRAFRLNLRGRSRREGDRKILLYAPTFDPELSAHPVLGGSFAASLLERFPELEIWVKPHPHIPRLEPAWMASLEEGTARHSRARILPPEADIYEILPEADILLSDCSSVFLYFLAFDRPVILVSNPLRFKSPKFDPEGPEWTLRSAAEEISTLDELPEALGGALAHPGAREAKRRELAGKVLGDSFDGRASERVIEGVDALLAGSPKPKKRLHGLLESAVLGFLPRYSLDRIEEREG
jgi:CDP-glycerol glycerophosphotransferase (TagB/SpsB family)